MNYVILNGQLYHAGVKGMKWGVRKARPKGNGRVRAQVQSRSSQSGARAKQARKSKAKKAIAIGAGVAATALAAYGAYKVGKYVKNKKAAIKLAQDREWTRSMQEAMRNASRSDISSGRATSSVVYDGAGRVIERLGR